MNPLPLPLLLALMHALEHGLNIDLRLDTLPLNPLLELSQLHLELLLPSFPLDSKNGSNPVTAEADSFACSVPPG